MHKLSLASGVLPEFGAVDVVEAAAAAGFDAAGLWVDPAEWTAQDTRETRAALARTGMPVLDVEVIWIKPDSVLDDHRKVIDVGGELGAANVLCVSSDPDHGVTADRLAALCRHAEGSGMRVALEFGIFTEVKNLTQALAVLERVGHPLRAVLIDPIHVDRSGTSVEQIAAIDPTLLPYAQFCDARAQRPDPADFDAVITDAIDLREPCGEGVLPLAALLQALPADIPLSLELRSAALRNAFSHPALRAKAVLEATRSWMDALA
ncbi:sugar phosphate isomerase/epimerase family protein [Novosphingobium album (ex Hu et al. 2023)]|uniref:Sugar phosphate isomerase/epimerase n=1 Tax=Novosphingobium album (ex Hu et al. 2023) TaxID=2930093 RepID=A0ABT0B1E7_9SPHN|nr:TIM barrel protein [Novosphingobium album (ex Hu et al. 2023)]MCJ2178753.1 sugar phosphate isomerase/epimerase [Novosphingobium album (ex Hu et al. 2023)]